ncbi:glycerate kinase [Luteococcus peritonei]|uniref:Glycerate kinase n=1 Tax=Luteococcus peritonei TaxID=88874 RepID=A0ABW4RQW0_9ACTN
MRVVVACGAFTQLTSAQTGAALARAWAELGARCAVVPIGEAGAGFGQAWADLVGAEPAGLWQLDGLQAEVHHRPADGSLCLALRPEALAEQAVDAASSHAAGAALARALADLGPAGGPRQVLLEIAEGAWHDGGAGFLAALGAEADVPLDQGVAALSGITRLDLAPVRELLAGAELHLVTRGEQAERHLTGLRGITSVRGHARGDHPGQMLAIDQALVDLAGAAGVPEAATAAGGGAAGGLGFAVLALGGRVSQGPRLCAELSRLARSMGQADLVVTGYDQLEFGTKGGDLLPEVTELAMQAMKPVVAMSRRNWISARELRTMGIEEAYSLATPDQVLDEKAITEASAASARTWTW